MSCCCWRKRKPGGSHHTGKKLSTDPSTCCWWKLRKADSSHDTAVLETDPLIETPNKPSTDQSLTCSSTISSNSQQPPPNLEEVLRSFKDLDITSQADAFIHAIEQYLEGATVQKNAPDTPTASPSNTDKLTNWDSFLQSGSEFLKFVSDHTEKNDKHVGILSQLFSSTHYVFAVSLQGDSFLSGEATKIAGKVLQKIGHLHWAVVGLSIVAYLCWKT
ncbi:uncharacterized protein LOC131033692 [Cryptomeria japonica]|uniref:uncharacterized protein LOC131033692 n=1 Tax=Cryptomeria japonica TaxID=3369 RepID=UPI0027DA045B|nr:uncharacterized protein LOC131033692 [Cryptomeria japonica]